LTTWLLLPGPGNFQDRQRYPAIPSVCTERSEYFPSYYDGLSLKLEKTFFERLSFLSSYTWSKTIDYLDSFVNGALGGQPFSNPTRFNIRSNKSLAGFDVPHRVVLSYIYETSGQDQQQSGQCRGRKLVRGRCHVV